MASNNIQTAAGSDLKADLEQMIRDGLDDIGNGYNSLEDRVYKVERNICSATGQTTNQRLVALESQTLPYEQQARDAATHIATVSERVKALQTDTGDHTIRISSLSKILNEVDARSNDSQSETNTTLQRLIKRVNDLESRTQHSQNDTNISPFTSAQDLAKALLVRLEGGDSLEAETTAQLKAAIGSSKGVDAQPIASRAPMRLPDTPSTEPEPESEPAAQSKPTRAKRKHSIEQEVPAKPAKRAKAPVKEVATKSSIVAAVKRSQPVAPREQRSSSRAQKAGSASATTSASTSFAEIAQPDSSQPRRTSREAKPTKRAN